MQYPGMTITQNGSTVTLVTYLGTSRNGSRVLTLWNGEDANGQLVPVALG